MDTFETPAVWEDQTAVAPETTPAPESATTESAPEPERKPRARRPRAASLTAREVRSVLDKLAELKAMSSYKRALLGKIYGVPGEPVDLTVAVLSAPTPTLQDVRDVLDVAAISDPMEALASTLGLYGDDGPSERFKAAWAALAERDDELPKSPPKVMVKACMGFARAASGLSERSQAEMSGLFELV